jgi:hypothetical protein
MPLSVPNLTGSTDPKAIPYGPITSFPSEKFPGYDATKSTIYRAADGKNVTVVGQGAGSGVVTYPCTEFLYVARGSITMKVQGGDHFMLRESECAQISKGLTIEFSCSEDFISIAVCSDSERVTLV